MLEVDQKIAFYFIMFLSFNIMIMRPLTYSYTWLNKFQQGEE